MITIRHVRNILVVTPVSQVFMDELGVELSYEHGVAEREGSGHSAREVYRKELRGLFYYNPEKLELMTPQGLRHRLMAWFDNRKIPYTYVDTRVLDTQVMKPDYLNFRQKVMKPGWEFRYKQDVILARLAHEDMGVILAPTGYGKSVAANVPILMADGNQKMSQDILKGDLVMGPDSTPRTVTNVNVQQGPCYDIIPTGNGMPWRCNGDHIICVKCTADGTTSTLTIDEYLTKSKAWKSTHKMYRVPVDFPERDVDDGVDPYVYGARIGNGQHSAEGILLAYKANTREIRLQVLAGILDTDGYVSGKNQRLAVTVEQKALAEDIRFLCNSLGLSAGIKEVQTTTCTPGANDQGTCTYAIGIRGDISQIPMRVLRKCPDNHSGGSRDPLVFGFKVVPVGDQEYYGMALDGDHLYLLGDCTVTHNTFLISALGALYPHANLTVATPGLPLVNDTKRRMVEIFGKDQVGTLASGTANKIKRITISTYKSLHKIPADHSDIILVDEVHRAASNELSTALQGLIPKKMFGFTATLTGRADGAEMVTESIMGPVIERVLYPEAVAKGIVAPMKAVFIPVNTGPSSSNYSQRVQKQRNLIWRNPIRNRMIAGAIDEYTRQFELVDPQILVLVDTVDHAIKLKALLPDFTLMYGSPGKRHKETLGSLSAKKKAQIQEDFADGKLKKVIATTCWGTGTDFPYLDMLVQATGCRSEINTLQFAGRCTRVNRSKDFGVVIDFADNWDTWARSRAQAREKYYRSLEWEVFS